jgi:hypothetical protein
MFLSLITETELGRIDGYTQKSRLNKNLSFSIGGLQCTTE